MPFAIKCAKRGRKYRLMVYFSVCRSQPIHMIASPLILQQPTTLDVLAAHNGSVQSVAAAKENILQSV